LAEVVAAQLGDLIPQLLDLLVGWGLAEPRRQQFVVQFCYNKCLCLLMLRHSKSYFNLLCIKIVKFYILKSENIYCIN
jgi:hypothetical protein